MGLDAGVWTGIKKIAGDPAAGIVVVTVDSDRFDTNNEDWLERVSASAQEQFPGMRVVVVPKGVNVKMLSVNGVYHYEHLDNYEIEIVARTEEDLRQRLATCQPAERTGEKK